MVSRFGVAVGSLEDTAHSRYRPWAVRPDRVSCAGGASWWDSFFMTVITVTTVGYEQEIPSSHQIVCGCARMGGKAQ